MRKATDQRDAQTISLLWTSLLLFHGGDVTCFDACHVIWCGGHVIWCDVIACVVSCHVMQCDVMWCALMWCALQWSRCVFEVVLWQCGDPKYFSVLQSTTVYYKVLLQYYSVLQSTTPVLLCTTQYYNVLLQYYSVLLQYYLYYKVLLQYYSVLQSTTPVLPCATKYYSSTTLYCKVLLQYYSVRHSTTTYYSSTTLYYKVLLQYYSDCKVLLQYYSVLHSTTTYYSSTTLYYKVLLQYYSVLQSTTPDVLLQYYSVLQSSIHDWSLTHMNRHLHDWCPSHMKRHLQCAEQQESSSNFTKYCTCHAKWLWWLIRVTYETSFTMRGATGVTIQLHQILRLNKSHDWSASHMKRHLQCAEQQTSHHNFSKYCACHAKWISWLIRVTYETSFTMRGASKVTLQTHQVLRLPRNSEFKISARSPWIASANIKTIRRHSEDSRAWNRHLAPAASETWLVPSWRRNLYRKIEHFALRLSPKIARNAAPATKSHTPTSPNTAPATQNESHDWSASHMKRHLECAEQQTSHDNFTIYCACHAKWISWLIRVTYETSFTMRGASTVSLQPHQILRLPRNL